MLLKLGPMTTFRPRLPKRETGVNTEVSNQASTRPRILIGLLTSGLRVPVTPFTVLFVSDDVYRVAALRLHDGGKLPAFHQPISAKWQFVYSTNNKPLTSVIVRQSPAPGEVIAVLGHDPAAA